MLIEKVYSSIIMEEVLNEHEIQQSFHSPPRRRRSTFFERRESFVPQPQSESGQSNICKKLSNLSEKQSQQLQRYYDKLLNEKEQWKKEVNSRKNKYHDMRQQYQLAAKAASKSRISYSTLSNEDIEFLKGKINLSKLVESQLKLHKSIKGTHALFKRAAELDDVILSYSEDKVKKITNYILENSTVDSIEDK